MGQGKRLEYTPIFYGIKMTERWFLLFFFFPKYANENTVCQLRITSKEECDLGQQCQLCCVGKQWKSGKILHCVAIFQKVVASTTAGDANTFQRAMPDIVYSFANCYSLDFV